MEHCITLPTCNDKMQPIDYSAKKVEELWIQLFYVVWASDYSNVPPPTLVSIGMKTLRSNDVSDWNYNKKNNSSCHLHFQGCF